MVDPIAMSQIAVLLMDLQTDFLAAAGARMPVFAADADNVLKAANNVLAGKALPGALPVIVVNQFPKSDRIANLFRNGAAIAGTLGAKLDERLNVGAEVRMFEKHRPSAFTNPDLQPYLKAHAVTQLFILGVFAEGCVRSTAIDAKLRGYDVTVPLDAIGTNREFKRRFAIWAMRRAGVNLAPMLSFA